MSRRDRQFSSVRTEGGLLPQDVLSRIQAGDKDLPGLTAADYHLGAHEHIGEAVNRAWSRLTGTWHAFQEALSKEPQSSLATGLTRDRWLLPLFEELRYGRLPKGQAITVAGKSFAVSHMAPWAPVHLLGAGVDLDRRQAGVAGAAKASPHGLVQEFLNRSEHHLWGFVSNGLRLRMLRDHHSLTRQAYVEFDLQAIMEGEQYSEFHVLWMVCHQSRVEADKPHDCWLETWFKTSRSEGVRALDKLRGGVEKAIEALATGFLANRSNTRLREGLESSELGKQEYYRQLLRLVYRLIFLFVAEERDALLDPDANAAAKNRYLRFYATRRLRELADKRRGGPYCDLWQGLRLVMSKLDDGCPDLALPALGSRLWGPTACPWLMDAECANEYLLDAVRRISTIEEGRTRYSVNWRNVGADELGSIYEGLLELHPRLNKEAGSFELGTAAGHERKTTGSYYTPTELVDCLLDSALDPVLDEASKKPDAEAAILDLTVCDPACGSGHFLVAAARRIAKRLAAVRAGEDEPSPREVQHALRDVVGRCIYGVDVNPMAVELCKVSLWMEAIEPGRPLSFLDSHIQSGNALLGATQDLMSKGIPDDAFKPIEGDDKKLASSLRKQNKKERKVIETGQETMFAAFEKAASRDITTVAQETRAIESATADDIGALRVKEERWGNLTRSAEYRDAWFLADAWCATFVWPMKAGHFSTAAITAARWRSMAKDLTAASPDSRRIVRQLAREFRFFHWHLAFPTVTQRGGFDLVIGNPPWDTLSPDQREFFEQYRPGMRSLAPDEQKPVIAGLLSDEAIAEAWAEHRRFLYATVHFLKSSGRFTLYAPGNLGKGDFNVYRMFVELALKGARPGGYAAQVCPGGLYGGANASAIRQFMLDECQLRHLLGLINTKRGWFEKVDIDRFCAYMARRGGSTKIFFVRFGLAEPADLSAAPIPVSADLIRQQAPDTYAIPDVREASDIIVSEKMYARHPPFGDEIAGPPHRHYMAEIHMGNDRALFTTDPAGLPVYEGRMIDHFDHRAKTYVSGHGNSSVWKARPFGDESKAIVPQWRVLQKDVPSKLGDRVDRYRIGLGDVANPRNERSFTSALIPPGTICGHTVPTIVFDLKFEWAYLPWLAVANSFVMDALARKKLSSPHMTYTLLDSLPLPRPRLTEPWVQHLAPLVLRLVCTAPEMTAYWNAMAKHGLCEAAPGNAVPPSALTDDDSRVIARAEIDAAVGRDVYGLTRQELSDVLDTFPVLQRRDVKAHGDYRTKRLILAAYDEAPAATAPAHLDTAALADGAWTRPTLDPRAEAGAALAAVLKAFRAPTSARTVRLAAILVLEPRLAVASFENGERTTWRRLVGAEADTLPSGVIALVPAADRAWGAAVRHLRGSGGLLEDSATNTWAPGPDLSAIHTAGWPDGRASMILSLLQRRGEREIVQRLPDTIQRWVHGAAA